MKYSILCHQSNNVLFLIYYFKVEWGIDLAREHECYLTEEVYK